MCRTANELGAGQGKRAERAASVAIAVATADAVVMGAVILGARSDCQTIFLLTQENFLCLKQSATSEHVPGA